MRLHIALVLYGAAAWAMGYIVGYIVGERKQ